MTKYSVHTVTGIYAFQIHVLTHRTVLTACACRLPAASLGGDRKPTVDDEHHICAVLYARQSHELTMPCAFGSENGTPSISNLVQHKFIRSSGTLDAPRLAVTEMPTLPQPVTLSDNDLPQALEAAWLRKLTHFVPREADRSVG